MKQKVHDRLGVTLAEVQEKGIVNDTIRHSEAERDQYYQTLQKRIAFLQAAQKSPHCREIAGQLQQGAEQVEAEVQHIITTAHLLAQSLDTWCEADYQRDEYPVQ